jgi:uncharacterized membrane protein (DUF485 family)
MFSYLWYRFIYFPELFVKDNRVDDFAEVYMSSNLELMKDKGDKIRERVRATRSSKLKWSAGRESLLKDGRLLQDDRFHSVASKYRRLIVILSLIFLAESGLNYFTALIAIPAAGGLAGALGTVLRVAAAIVVTVVGIVGAEVFFDEVLPSEKYGTDAAEGRHTRNWARAVLWGTVLVGTEFMIYHFGLLRVRDIGAGKVDPDIAYSIIILSMIVPVIGGGIAWEVSNILDAYKNRLKFDRLSRQVDRADTRIETLNEQENSYLQRETNAYWRMYNKLRGYKEYYNHKRKVETPHRTVSRLRL